MVSIMKNNKIVNIRALAILIVVLGHSIILYSKGWWFYQSIYSVPFLDKLKNFINIIQMPLFFSISGFLFYYSLNKKSKFKNFLIKKSKRLLIPFIIIGICWMIPIKLLVHYAGYQDLSFLKIIGTLFLGTDSGHLWYLPTLFIIFIIVFIMKKILDKKYDIIIAIILLIISYISMNLNIYPYLNQALYYLYYFYIGFLINKYQTKNINIYLLLGITISSFILLITFNNIKLLEYIFTTLFIFLIYQIISNKENKIIQIISENSYGIYLIHSPLIYITYTYLTNINPIMVVFINFVIFGIIALLLSILIRRTKLKFILGEG